MKVLSLGRCVNLISTLFPLISITSLVGQAPESADTATLLQVPADLRYPPFDVDRYLNLPSNFAVSVYARVPDARFMAAAPNGDILVSQPVYGTITLLRPQANGEAARFTFASGLYHPHDMLFHTIGDTTWLYVAEANQIDRFIYNPGDTFAHDEQVLITGLPCLLSVQGGYNHELKNIAVDSADRVYVSVGSTTNADPVDRLAQPMRGAIYQYQPDGSGGRLFAAGVRNAEGVRFIPGTDTLWAAINQRDDIAYPFQDSTGLYGQVVTSYVDGHPPDEFTSVRDGGDYGWPYANPNPDTPSFLDDMPFDPDYQNNPNGSLFPVSSFDIINKGIPAHSAPLGLTFLQDTAFLESYRQGATIALHGSWDRTILTGYKVIYFPWQPDSQTPGAQMDLVTGWLNDATQQYWGRPVGTAVDPSGNLFISDDLSGTVYEVTLTSSASFNGRVFSVVASSSGKCMQVVGAVPDDGIQVVQQTCDGSAGQLWRLTEVDGGHYWLASLSSGKALDVTGGPAATSDGVPLQQWDYWAGRNQTFDIIPFGNGSYSLIARSSGKCADVRGGPAATGDGVPIQQWTCWRGANQMFQLLPMPNSGQD